VGGGIKIGIAWVERRQEGICLGWTQVWRGNVRGRNNGERGIVWGEIKTMGNCKSEIMMGRELSDLE